MKNDRPGEGEFWTRIAPSPTGDMHFGTARTAYFNWLAARASGGKFILRIDDTDINRNDEKHVQDIIDTMKWLGLDHDHIFRQSERTALYQDFASTLKACGLTTELNNGATALKWFDRYGCEWEDAVAGRPIPITDTNKEQIDGKLILLRGHPKEPGQADLFGKPTYQFASVVDDWCKHINTIIRGTDHISNTPKQVAIWMAINEAAKGKIVPVPLPKFWHVGLIFRDGKKLSKRDGAAAMLTYKKGGYLPEAVLNVMLRLGWGGKEIPDKPITKEQAVHIFFKGRMKNTNINFDPSKLDFLNKYYARL